MNLQEFTLPQPTSQQLVTGLAGVFALVSVQNIAHFFIDLRHPMAASWTLGLAIGTALVVLAHLLSEVDMRETKAFAGLLTVTLILVALSGIIQGIAYSHTLGVMGYVLAFTLAATGEIVLPLAHSWHKEAQRRQAVHDAGSKVEELAAGTLVDVMAGVDVARAQRQAEKRIEQLVVAHVDCIVRKLMPDSPKTAIEAHREPLQGSGALCHPVTQEDAERALKPPSTPSISSIDNSAADGFVQQMADGKREKADARRAQLLQILTEEFNGVNADQLNKTALGARLDTTRQTIARDMLALQESGLLSMNGVVQVTG